MHLLIKIKSSVQEYYQPVVNPENVGYDLYFEEDYEILPNTKQVLKFGIQCEVKNENQGQNVAYFLIPRSSISKTHLFQVNSIGVIDASYRGEIMAIVYNYGTTQHSIKKGERLFQLVPIHQGLPFDSVTIVNDLSKTERGMGGFGSTGK